MSRTRLTCHVLADQDGMHGLQLVNPIPELSVLVFHQALPLLQNELFASLILSHQCRPVLSPGRRLRVLLNLGEEGSFEHLFFHFFDYFQFCHFI